MRLTVCLSQFKIVPLLGSLATELQISLGQVSWLMAVFTVAGVALAIPSGAILNAVGPKRLLVLLMLTVVAGNVLGAIATGYPLLMVSRVIEGIAFAMIILVGIVLISGWFAEGGAATAIGIFTTFPPAAALIAINLALPVNAALGERGVWWVVAALGATALALVWSFLPADPPGAVSQEEAKPTFLHAASNPRAWLLAICQFAVAFVLFTFITIYPTLFVERYDLPAPEANFFAGLIGLFSIPFAILGGWILDKTGKPVALIGISFIGLFLASLATDSLGPATYAVHPFVTAAFGGPIIAAVLAVAPSVAKTPALIGHTIALINQLYFVGIFVGAPAVLMAVDASGWQAASFILAGVALLGLAAICVYVAVDRRNPGGRSDTLPHARRHS